MASNIEEVNNESVKEETNEEETDTSDNIIEIFSDSVQNVDNKLDSNEDSVKTNSLNLSHKSELLNDLLKSLHTENDWHLPFKKRRISIANVKEDLNEEISYPLTPMISIAEVEDLQNIQIHNSSKIFKTAAERKEMPSVSPYSFEHNFDDPTLNYHLTNVPISIFNIPSDSYYPVPPAVFPQTPSSNKKLSRMKKQHHEVT